MKKNIVFCPMSVYWEGPGSSSPRLSSTENRTTIYLVPAFTIMPRWYYNLQKRSSKGKSISGNSGDYLGLSMHYVSGMSITKENPEVPVPKSFLVAPRIGRRFAHQNWVVEAGLGYGALFENGRVGGALAAELSLGYMFGHGK
jgi:hypothetical protein